MQNSLDVVAVARRRATGELRRVFGVLLASCVLSGYVVVQETASAAGTPPDTGELRIHFLDVGQADATLIEAPSGQRILIDAGRDTMVVVHLRRLEVDTIHLFIASHNHADHIGGAEAVLRAFPVRFFMDNGVPHTTATYRRLLEALHALDVPLLEPERRTVTVGDATLEILPPPGDPRLDHNGNSIGVVLIHGEFRASFAGDAEAALWRHWLERYPELVDDVAVHKASHHGSRNGDTSEALARLRPDVVVVSAGAGNSYGHPHAEALARYEAVGATVYATAEAGTVTVAARPDGGFEVSFERGNPGGRTAVPAAVGSGSADRE